MQLPLSSNSNNQNGVKLMRDWFPRHWKCRPVSEMVNNLGGIQSVCLPLSYLIETATLVFIVCGNDTLWKCRLCTAVRCSGSELSATSGESWIPCFDFIFSPTPQLLKLLFPPRPRDLCRGFEAEVTLRSPGMWNCHSWWWGRKVFNWTVSDHFCL